jgi:hypothetical protein
MVMKGKLLYGAACNTEPSDDRRYCTHDARSSSNWDLANHSLYLQLHQFRPPYFSSTFYATFKSGLPKNCLIHIRKILTHTY